MEIGILFGIASSRSPPSWPGSTACCGCWDRSSWWRKVVGILAAFGVIQLAVLPAISADFQIFNAFDQGLLFQACTMTMVALGLNLIYGFNGQFSLAQWGFYGIGAYVRGGHHLPLDQRGRPRADRGRRRRHPGRPGLILVSRRACCSASGASRCCPPSRSTCSASVAAGAGRHLRRPRCSTRCSRPLIGTPGAPGPAATSAWSARSSSVLAVLLAGAVRRRDQLPLRPAGAARWAATTSASPPSASPSWSTP